MRKTQNYNLETFLLAYAFVFLLCNLTYAKEIAILYTGETHAMLYPCNCPKEPDGGIARRATLIKQLRKENPDTLVLDSGGFFGGGLLDEYTQNIDFDRQRTLVNLKAIELMQYDALTIGDDEFNFNQEFLLKNIDKTNLTFLSCNILLNNQSALFKSYIIKEMSGSKIGIIGVTTLQAAQKAGGLKFIEPESAVEKAVVELKKKNVDIIILLSHLGENDDLKLIEEIKGIDILITGHFRAKEESSSKIGSTLIVRPSWQGRRLGKLSLTLENNKIKDYKVEELRLSDKIQDDPGELSILPRCFSDNNCKKEGGVGICQDPGTLKSQCSFSKPAQVSLLIIQPKPCRFCDSEKAIKYLKTFFPGLTISYRDYPSLFTNKLIKDFNLKALPVYILGKEVEKEKAFSNLEKNLEAKGNYYILKPEFAGVSYLLERKDLKDRLDLFISLYDLNIAALLDVIKGFNPVLHFLAAEKDDGFDAAKGNLEVEEYLRCVCVQKYYPKMFFDYTSCRAGNLNSSWWEDCLDKSATQTIKTCARSEEGKQLLRENIKDSKELKIMFGPAYLLDNRYIFGIQGVPRKEELKKILGIR